MTNILKRYHFCNNTAFGDDSKKKSYNQNPVKRSFMIESYIVCQRYYPIKLVPHNAYCIGVLLGLRYHE